MMNENPWEPMYQRMRDELPENEIERETLRMLAAAVPLSECEELWEKNGYTGEDFHRFMLRANEWENTHMCGPGKYES